MNRAAVGFKLIACMVTAVRAELDWWETHRLSIGLQADSSDVVFRGKVAEDFLPRSGCRLIPAYTRDWSLFVRSADAESRLREVEFVADSEFVSFSTAILCEEEHCEVKVENVCLKSGEMRVQVVFSFLGGEQTSVFVRKKCGGVMAEGLTISVRSQPAEAPVVVVTDGVANMGLRPYLSVTEDRQVSWLTISSAFPYSLDFLSLRVADSDILSLSLAGDVREVHTSFLQEFSASRLIDNLSEDYVQVVGRLGHVSLQQLDRLLNGKQTEVQKVTQLRIEPRTKSEFRFPEFVHTQSGPISDSPTEIKVSYKCLQPGVTEIELTLQVKDTYNPYEPVSFRWDKTCGGFLSPYLRIGTEKGKFEVLQQGIVQGKYATGTAAIPVYTRQSQFFLSVLEGTQEIAQPTIATTAECQGKASPLSSSLVSDTNYENFTVSYLCLSRGDCGITATLDMVPPMSPYGPVVFRWTKVCGGPIAGLSVYSSAALHEKSSPDIIKNGTYVAGGLLQAEDRQENIRIGLAYSLPERLKTRLRVTCKDDVCDPLVIEGSNVDLSAAIQLVTIDISCRKSGESTLTLALIVLPT